MLHQTFCTFWTSARAVLDVAVGSFGQELWAVLVISHAPCSLYVLPTRLLKAVIDTIAPFITGLFNCSLVGFLKYSRPHKLRRA